MSLSSFRKVRGKPIYYVEFGTGYIHNIASYLDTKKFQHVFRTVDYDLASAGVCIEPLTVEQKNQVQAGNKVSMNQNEIQEGSLCLLFYKPDSIDAFIKLLNGTKEVLIQKIKDKKEEEYRKKYCGRVILMSDLLHRKEVSAND